MPHDICTYDAWLRGEDLLTRWSQEAEDEAERLFERAIAADPDFAPAHASLASVYNTRHFIRPGIEDDAGTSRRARPNSPSVPWRSIRSTRATIW